MDERVVQARVGIVVISALLLTAILIVLFGEFPSRFRAGTVIHVRFTNAPGVTEGTPVRKSGILIGRVERVAFIKNSPDVQVTLRLNSGVELYQNEECHIATNSLLGDAVLEFVSIKPISDQLITDGMPIVGVSGRNPLQMITSLEGDLRTTIQSVGTASKNFGDLASQLNQFVGGQDDEQLQRLFSKSERTLDSINTAMMKLNRVLGDEATQDNLQKSLQDIPGIVQQTQSALAGIQRAVHSADRNLQNLEGLTGPLGEHGPAIVNRLDSSINQFDQVMRQMVIFTDRVNSQEGTLGQLMKNPELYNNLSRAAENIERLTTELRPVMNDVRIFTDKIARDPSQLGIAGALKRNKDSSKYPNYRWSEEPPMHWREDLKPPVDWRAEPARPTVVYP